MKNHKWAQLLSYATGMVNQQLLLQNEYLTAENRILRAHLPKRIRLTDPQRVTLAESANGLVAKLWNSWPVSLNRTQYLSGTAGWLLRNSTVPDIARIRAGLLSTRKLSSYW